MLIQGVTLAGVLLDEVVLMPRSFVEQALARCSVTGAKLWFNCNPDVPEHWFRRDWLLKLAQKDATHLHFTLDDNPGLSEGTKARYRSVYAGVFKRRYIDGEWTAGLVRDIGDPDFGLPEFYRVEGGDGVVSARIHHFRVIRFTGRELPWLEQAVELYWGESEVEALYQDVVKHDNVSANMAALTFRANVDTMEVETGLFGSITEEEIVANRGKTYQDLTALRDPLAGLDFGGNDPGPFEQETGDGLTLDYKGQPRAKNGQFTYGKLGVGSTKGKKAGKIKSSKVKMSRKEFERVTSGFFTDHPKLKPGEIKVYAYGTYQYRIFVKGPGEYDFISRIKLK